jgi:hypothetical protein
LLWGGVHPALDLVECFREVPDGEGLAETSAPLILLFVAFTSGVPVVVGLAGRSVAGQLVCWDVLKVLSGTGPEGVTPQVFN